MKQIQFNLHKVNKMNKQLLISGITLFICFFLMGASCKVKIPFHPSPKRNNGNEQMIPARWTYELQCEERSLTFVDNNPKPFISLTTPRSI